VWNTLAAFGRYPDWIDSYDSTDFLTVDKAGLRVKWRQAVFGRSHSQGMRIDAWNQPYDSSQARLRVAQGTWCPIDSSRGTGEQPSMRFAVQATNVVTKLFQTGVPSSVPLVADLQCEAERSVQLDDLVRTECTHRRVFESVIRDREQAVARGGAFIG
jgi:hypothetical protein